MKLLGLDVGQKRIGVALSEDKIVSTYSIIAAENLENAIAEVSRIVRAENIDKIIIGIPKNNNTLQADKIHLFAMELTKILSVQVEYVDESFTSVEAERTIQKLDPKSSKYKEEVDKISAKLILEQYLNQ